MSIILIVHSIFPRKVNVAVSKQASTVFCVVSTSNDQLQLMLQHSAVYAHAKTINLAAETRKITEK